MRLLIQNGYLIDPSQGINTGKNLFIEDGRVVGLLGHGEAVPEGSEIFDATGLVVAPGFIDMHVHLREPGQEYKETANSRYFPALTSDQLTEVMNRSRQEGQSKTLKAFREWLRPRVRKNLA